jgi:phage FluMu protein Com
MERFRCTNPICKKPVLFEGDFVGTIKKKCPKCKEIIEFKQFNSNKLEKFCDLSKK